jgi:hypothetical protein
VTDNILEDIFGGNHFFSNCSVTHLSKVRVRLGVAVRCDFVSPGSQIIDHLGPLFGDLAENEERSSTAILFQQISYELYTLETEFKRLLWGLGISTTEQKSRVEELEIDSDGKTGSAH